MDISNNTVIRFGQINTARSFAWTIEAELIMREMNIDIMALQEPYSSGGKIYVPNVVYDTGCERPMSCILNKNNSRAMLITSLSDEFFTTMNYVVGENNLYIVSAYFKYNQPYASLVERLRYIIKELGNRMILVCGDFNAKSSWWYSAGTDERGELLQELIIEEGLTIHNTPQMLTTFENVHGRSNIDLTLSKNLECSIAEWKVHDRSSSDHRLITFDVDLGDIRITNEQKGFTLHGANWNLFAATLRKEVSFLKRLTINSREDIDCFVKELTTSLVIASQVSLKQKQYITKNSFVLTDEAKKLRSSMRWFRRQLKVSRTEENLSNYRKARNAYKNEIRCIKHRKFKEFIVKHSDDPWGPSYKALKVRPSTNQISVINPITQKEEYCFKDNILSILNTLFPNDDPEEDSHRQAELRRLACLPSQAANDSPFTMEEIERVITQMKKGKAPGPDGILPDVLIRAAPLILAILERLFNACLELQYFPSDWKLARVVLLKKDTAANTAKSFRPICLLNTLSKALEGVLIERVLKHVSDKLSPKQYGFTFGKSTTDAINNVLSTVDSMSCKYVVLVCLDISGAFDNAWWPCVAEQLRRFNCPGNLYGLLGQFFNSRAIKYETSEFSIHRMVERGCPQGSKAGPRCWNILMDSLLRQFDDRENIEIVAYADDTALLVGADSRTGLEKAITPLLEEVVIWGENNKLKFNSSKTECVLLKGTLKRLPIIKMSNETIKFKREVKYLGMVLDSRLSFEPHARYIADKAVKKFTAYRVMARKDFGIRTGVLRTIYRGIFESVISYGAVILSTKLNSTIVKILVTAQRKALLVLTKAYRTTPNAALTIIGGVLPVKYLIRYRAECVNKNISREYIKSMLITEWQKEWCESTNSRVLYEALPNPAVVINLGIELSHAQVQFLTGHGRTRSYLNRFFPDKFTTDICQCKAAKQDFLHLLFVCRCFVEERSELVGYCYRGGIAWPPPLSLLLIDKGLFAIFNTFASLVCDFLTFANKQ